MSERIAAAANQLTPDQVKSAHDALVRLFNNAHSDYGGGTQKFKDRDAIIAAIPPLPEPERPRITPARELAVEILSSTPGGPIGTLKHGIHAARAEIIALLEWEGKHCEDPDCQGCYLRRRWIHELHSADTP